MSWKAKILKKISLYIEIVSVLEIDIKRRILKPGDKLPPQRELEDFLDVNLSTIKKLEM
ncbi:GntR family transcriptional regulator [Clostridium saccharoperbutylacetonicum]|uniref:GntR family transcriptional regulator n=2 Tax=Clostridium saccharoperbutylacetonicum TaxID=36745 RepID=UPI000345BFFE|nr:GntR family transcriptional regulator [Clostridium saccharoperbutylacetonicum]